MKRDTRSVFEGLLLAWASVVKKHHVWFLAVVGVVAISSMVLAQPGHVPQPSATPTPTGAPPLPPSLPAAAPSVEAASIAGGRVVTYTYDEAGRLVGADYGGGSSISYAYDAGGNLVSREVETAVQCDKLTNVEITAPATTTVGEATNFTASVTPMTATTELTFTWQATGQVGQQRVAVVSDTVVFTWPMTGPQKVTVTAANPCSVAVSDTHSITATNEPPVADARAGQSVTIGDVVTLDGSGSSDPDGHMPLAYGWAQVGGPDVSLSSSATVSPTFTAPGTPTVLTFTLTVTDAYGLASAPGTVVVAVGDVPIAGLSAESSSPHHAGQRHPLDRHRHRRHERLLRVGVRRRQHRDGRCRQPHVRRSGHLQRHRHRQQRFRGARHDHRRQRQRATIHDPSPLYSTARQLTWRDLGPPECASGLWSNLRWATRADWQRRRQRLPGEHWGQAVSVPRSPLRRRR